MKLILFLKAEFIYYTNKQTLEKLSIIDKYILFLHPLPFYPILENRAKTPVQHLNDLANARISANPSKHAKKGEYNTKPRYRFVNPGTLPDRPLSCAQGS